MSDVGASAPASREEIKATLSTSSSRDYPRRKEFREWLADDPDGAKAKWLKGQEP